MEGEGFIRLYWKTTDSVVGENITALGLWARILLGCAVKRQILRNGEVLEPGECIISATKIADGAGMTSRTLQRYIKALESAGMIRVLNVSRNGTHLSVCNFKAYQPQFFADVAKRRGNDEETTNERQMNDEQTENPNIPKSPKSVRRFTPPTVDEVREYCNERNNSVDPESFIDHYETNGWVQGKGKPVKDWKACVRTWEKNSYQRRGSPYESRTDRAIREISQMEFPNGYEERGDDAGGNDLRLMGPPGR